MLTRPQIVLRVGDGPEVAVSPGGIIGRLQTAALRIADPRVPEAAALVSLRGRELHLLALRGGLQLDEHEEEEVVAEAGMVVTLAGAVALSVVRVDLPERVLGLKLGDDVRELCASVYSLVTEPALDLVPALVDGAPARLWSTAEGWAIDLGRGPEPIRPGRSWSLGEHTVTACEIALGEAAVAPTTSSRESLTVVNRGTTVHIQRPRRPVLAVDGLPANILSELAAMQAPAPWELVAGEIWGRREPGRHRMSWDRALRRLRLRLREGGVREDLVRTDGKGNVELYLYPGDKVVDES